MGFQCEGQIRRTVYTQRQYFDRVLFGMTAEEFWANPCFEHFEGASGGFEMIDPYEISEDKGRLDFATVHRWLTGSYWSPGITREKVEEAARGSSLVVGAYHGETQVGYLRVISDKSTFAWIADVFVDEAHRGHGIAKAMVRFALEHSEHQGLRRWMLATADAHTVYQAVGFHALELPDRYLMLRP